MGPKKKPPRSAFYFFMLDWREEQEQDGLSFPRGLEEIREKAAPAWKNLDPAVQAAYKAKADEEKAKEKFSAVKYTSQGVKVQDVEREAHERAVSKNSMERTIINTVAYLAKRPEALKQHAFYAIHCNPFVYWAEEERFIAAEVAVVEFSIEEGVRNTLHFFPEIAAKDKAIPTGYALQARRREEKQHGIPSDHEEKRVDYRSMYLMIKSFVTPNGGAIPPLYTMGNNEALNFSATCVENFLEEVAFKTSTEPFKVYDIALLFYELEGACTEIARMTNPSIKPLPTISIAIAEFERDVFQYAQGLSCKFHETKASDWEHGCSLSIATRWAFLITGEYCCERLGISQIPGKHVPFDSKLPSTLIVKEESTRGKQSVAERLERSRAPQGNAKFQNRGPPPPAIRIKDEPAATSPSHNRMEKESVWDAAASSPDIDIKEEVGWSTVQSSRHKSKNNQARRPTAAPSLPRNKKAPALNDAATPPAQEQSAWGAASLSDFKVKEEFTWSTVPPSSRNKY